MHLFEDFLGLKSSKRCNFRPKKSSKSLRDPISLQNIYHNHSNNPILTTGDQYCHTQPVRQILYCKLWEQPRQKATKILLRLQESLDLERKLLAHKSATHTLFSHKSTKMLPITTACEPGHSFPHQPLFLSW